MRSPRRKEEQIRSTTSGCLQQSVGPEPMRWRDTINTGGRWSVGGGRGAVGADAGPIPQTYYPSANTGPFPKCGFLLGVRVLLGR